MSPEGISEISVCPTIVRIENLKIWWVPFENGETRTHLGELQGSVEINVYIHIFETHTILTFLVSFDFYLCLLSF
jgi:hypothetical protein